MASIVVGYSRRTNFGGGQTRYFPVACIATPGSTTEANYKRTVRSAGTYSNMLVRVFSSNSTGASTMTFRKNGAGGNQTVSIGIAATGEFEDTTHNDAVVATDLIDLEIVIGAAVAFRTSVMQCVFAPTSNTAISHGLDSLTTTATSTTVFGKYVGGAATASATETTSQQFKMKAAGTIKNLNVVVTTNGRADATTVGSRLNGAPGALTVSINAAATGQFEDTTHSDTVVADDLVDRYVTVGTGSGTFTASIYNDFETSDGTTQNVAGGPATILQNVTNYLALMGEAVNSVTTESDSQQKAGVTCTLSKLEIHLSANTVSASSTLTSRKNAGAGGQSVSITASTTGWFEDASNSDSIVATDEIGAQLVTGAGGTSMVVQYVACKVATPTSSARAILIGGKLVGGGLLMNGLA
jgi:hypothetical protein